MLSCNSLFMTHCLPQLVRDFMEENGLIKMGYTNL